MIDRIKLTQMTAQSLRATPEYRQAVADYGKAQAKLEFFNRILDLAGPIMLALLAAA